MSGAEQLDPMGGHRRGCQCGTGQAAVRWGQTFASLAGLAMTSRAWKGWEQVWGPYPKSAAAAGCPVGTAAAAGLGVVLTQPLFSADITVICPWEAFSHLELHELAQYGII